MMAVSVSTQSLTTKMFGDRWDGLALEKKEKERKAVKVLKMLPRLGVRRMTPRVCWTEGWAWSVEKLKAGSRGVLELARLMHYVDLLHAFIERLLCARPGSEVLGTGWLTKMDKTPALPELTFKGNNNPNRRSRRSCKPCLSWAVPSQIFLCALMKNNSVQIH